MVPMAVKVYLPFKYKALTPATLKVLPWSEVYLPFKYKALTPRNEKIARSYWVYLPFKYKALAPKYPNYNSIIRCIYLSNQI